MLLPMFLLLIAAAFITQLAFCLYAKKLWIKLLPIGIAVGLDLACWLFYLLGTFSAIYGGDFAAFIYGIVLLVMAAAAALGWGVYAIVRFFKRRNGSKAAG